MDQQSPIKKKIMFSKGDDFYFLSYNILIILYGLGCFCGKRALKDYRKLAFLIDFVSNRNLATSAKRNEPILNPIDRESFTRAYASGLIRLNQIIRILFTLEKKGFVTLQRDSGKDIVNVCLNSDAINEDFFDNELFKHELENLKTLSVAIQRSTSITLDKLLTRLFDNHGIKTWAEY